MSKKIRKFKKGFDDGDYGYEDDHRRDHKGRDRGRGTGEIWAEMEGLGDDTITAEIGKVYEEKSQHAPGRSHLPQQPQRPQGERRPIELSAEFTVEIKGIKIDLSRLEDMKKVDTVYNGRNSFGIEFTFNSKRGLGRTMWYGTNRRQRDEEYAQYEAIRAKARK